MADNERPDNYGNYQDNGGKLYHTPDGKPPSAGTPVKIFENGESHEGIWSGGNAQKNRG